MTIYPTVNDVLYLYAVEILGNPGVDTLPYLRSHDLLDSALHRPQQLAYYEDANLLRQAATLLWGLVRNHPFTDGNKRIALLTAAAFLDANGWILEGSTEDKVTLVEAAVNCLTVDEVEVALFTWVRESPE